MKKKVLIFEKSKLLVIDERLMGIDSRDEYVFKKV
jgi:ABC-type Mn2+/Zn2+ transport system ATPase subunit